MDKSCFYKFVSNFTNKLVKQLLSMTVQYSGTNYKIVRSAELHRFAHLPLHTIKARMAWRSNIWWENFGSFKAIL